MVRTKAFDEAEALQAALGAFWVKGYEATSTADLVKAMGIGRQSLYDTFGDKHQLYIKALQSYQEQGAARIRQILESAVDPLEGILSILRHLAQAPACDRQRGCMLVNSLTERSPQDPEVLALGLDHLAVLQTLMEDALRRAQAKGKVPAGRDLRSHARLVVVTMYGLSVLGKSGAESATLEDAVAALGRTLTT